VVLESNCLIWGHIVYSGIYLVGVFDSVCIPQSSLASAHLCYRSYRRRLGPSSEGFIAVNYSNRRI
jgi:hypothetical protein